MVDAHPMKGGDGEYSYTRNSHLQREAIGELKGIVEEAISEKLDLKTLLSTSSSNNSILLADFGCSVGPNTFICMLNLIEAIQRKLESQGISSSTLEFQVFFNDHASNDFNTLFASLPSERPYFAAGVPGSFYHRLFPKSSLHLVHSSYALQWLSQVPAPVLDETSPAYNRGRIYYTSAPEEVKNAYASQFEKDVGVFLEARAQEMAPGGMMILLMIAKPYELPNSSFPAGLLFDLIGLCLIDMVKEGLISEAQVDTFNIPVYVASMEEMREVVERNGCFSIEKLELAAAAQGSLTKSDAHALMLNYRAGCEGIIGRHFGTHVLDELFGRFHNKIQEFSSILQASLKHNFQLLNVLKRK